MLDSRSNQKYHMLPAGDLTQGNRHFFGTEIIVVGSLLLPFFSVSKSNSVGTAAFLVCIGRNKVVYNTC